MVKMLLKKRSISRVRVLGFCIFRPERRFRVGNRELREALRAHSKGTRDVLCATVSRAHESCETDVLHKKTQQRKQMDVLQQKTQQQKQMYSDKKHSNSSRVGSRRPRVPTPPRARRQARTEQRERLKQRRHSLQRYEHVPKNCFLLAIFQLLLIYRSDSSTHHNRKCCCSRLNKVTTACTSRVVWVLI